VAGQPLQALDPLRVISAAEQFGGNPGAAGKALRDPLRLLAERFLRQLRIGQPQRQAIRHRLNRRKTGKIPTREAV
jgi:hypothetical protein